MILELCQALTCNPYSNAILDYEPGTVPHDVMYKNSKVLVFVCCTHLLSTTPTHDSHLLQCPPPHLPLPPPRPQLPGPSHSHFH
jgi:hypothetical protein